MKRLKKSELLFLLMSCTLKNTCTDSWKDTNYMQANRALYVLAAINVVSISAGVYSFYLRFQTGICTTHDVIFYSMTLSCLVVAEFYFLSGLWEGEPCT